MGGKEKNRNFTKKIETNRNLEKKIWQTGILQQHKQEEKVGILQQQKQKEKLGILYKQKVNKIKKIGILQRKYDKQEFCSNKNKRKREFCKEK